MNTAGSFLESNKINSGLECLKIIASLFGHRLDVHKIRRENCIQENRSCSDDLLRIARAEGFRAKFIKADSTKLKACPLPAVGETKDGQFFVLARINDRSALILRPEPGGRPEQVSLDDLALMSSGRLLLMTRREHVPEGLQVFGIRWFLPIIQRFRALLLEVVFISFTLGMIGLITPILFQVVIDKVLVHRTITTLQVIIIALVVVNVSEACLTWLRTYAFSHSTSRIDALLGAKLFKHLISLPIAYFETRATGQTIARVRELENIRQFLTSSALTLAIDTVFGLIFIAVMFYYSPGLASIVLASLPVYAIISLVLTPPLKRRVQEKFLHGATNQSFLVENLSGIHTLKALAIEPQMRMRWDQILAAYISASFRVTTLSATGSQLISVTSKLTTAALLYFGAHAVMNSNLTIGELVAFNMLAGQVSGPVLRIAQLWQDFQQFKLSVDRVGDILNTPPEREAQQSRQELPAIQGNISFQSIVFRYSPGSSEVLRNLTLSIRKGEVIGVVGKSGSGKSTLTKLLQRLYVPELGRVLVDGNDISMLDPAWLRQQIGVVLQENVLFSRSVRENIALADPTMPIERVVHAAKLSGAHDFILELPQGYDTILEERGSNLSGGQRQRIAIARALIMNPRILIFDEATSALDYESERIVQSHMKSICAGRTVLIVAHRLSTIRNCNRIAVIDRGQVKELGSHTELMAGNGLYASMVRLSGG